MLLKILSVCLLSQVASSKPQDGSLDDLIAGIITTTTKSPDDDYTVVIKNPLNIEFMYIYV